MINFLKKKKTFKVKAVFLILVVIVCLALFFPEISLAVEEYSKGDFGGGPSGIAMAFVSNLLLALMNTLGAWILLPLVNMVAGLVEFNHFVDSQAVEIGWKLVRDLSNMFFVVILLIIAFSTILKISNYHYKQTLFKLLLMAILVNFSKTIMGFLIDFGQVIMMTFVNAFSGSAAPILVKNLMVTKLLNIEPNAPNLPDKWSIFAALLLGVIMLVVAIGVMLAYVAVLLYRIISLWILVLLSPLAFVLSAFTGTAKYASEFWNKFWNQLTTGIILAFFMWLSFSILSTASADPTVADRAPAPSLSNLLSLVKTGQVPDSQSASDIDEGKTPVGVAWEDLFLFIVTIALLLMGLQYAQQAGGFAGNFAGKVSGKLQQMGSAPFRGAQKIARGVGKAVAKPVKFGAKRATMAIESKILDTSTKTGANFFQKGLKYFTKAGIGGFLKRGDEMTQRSRERAEAYAHDEANFITTIGKLKTSHGANMAERHAKQTAEDYTISGLEELKAQFGSVMNMKDSREKDDRIRGLFAIASREAWVDDLMEIDKVRKALMTGDEKEDVEERITFREEKYLEVKADIEKDEDLQDIIKDTLKGRGIDEDSENYNEEFEKEKEKTAREDANSALRDKYGNDDIYAGINRTSRQKQGQFLQFIATSSETSKVSQEGLNLVYAHEQNAFNTGHLEDIGYARAHEGKAKIAKVDIYDKIGKDKNNKPRLLYKKGDVIAKAGQMRMLDFEKKDESGYTEADKMGLVEISKKDPKKMAGSQMHSFGNVRGDNTLDVGADDYFKSILEIVGGADEAYKLNLNSRTSQVVWGGTAVDSPKAVDKESDIPMMEVAANKLKEVLTGFESKNGRVVMGRAYDLIGGDLKKASGIATDIRTAPKSDGYMILKSQVESTDKDGKKIMKEFRAGIDMLTGKMGDLIKSKEKVNKKDSKGNDVKDDDGNVIKVEKEIWKIDEASLKSVEEYMEEKKKPETKSKPDMGTRSSDSYE